MLAYLIKIIKSAKVSNIKERDICLGKPNIKSEKRRY